LDVSLGKEFGGGDLSGGEWQKVAIARALYKEGCFVVLDEPTSALDPLIESEILGKFIAVMKDKTAVIVSHRIGLCKLVDKLVVMKDGKIAGYGPHDELLETNAYYRKLFFEQQKWYV
jgi:ABC-type multidrug transport system fused ATPase/permease subunit